MDSTTLLEEVKKANLRLESKGEKLRVIAPFGKRIPKNLIPELKRHKKELVGYLEKQALRSAVVRLILGETDKVRIYSRTLDGEALLIRDELKNEIKVDIPIFTIKELYKLAKGCATKEDLKRIYLAKKIFNDGCEVTFYGEADCQRDDSERSCGGRRENKKAGNRK